MARDRADWQELARLSVGQDERLERLLWELGAEGGWLRDWLERVDSELCRLRAAASAREDEQELFAFAVAHDLRQPLLASLLAMDGLPDSTDGQLVRACVQASLERVEGLLALAGLVWEERPRTEVPVGALVGAADQRLRATYPDRVYRLEADLQATLRSDAGLVAILIDNLVENAVRHGGASGALVRVQVETRAAPDGTVNLLVRDDGVGIDVARAHGRTAGTGIGLAVCRRAARTLGARLAIGPCPSGGTEARVSFVGG